MGTIKPIRNHIFSILRDIALRSITGLSKRLSNGQMRLQDQHKLVTQTKHSLTLHSNHWEQSEELKKLLQLLLRHPKPSKVLRFKLLLNEQDEYLWALLPLDI